MIGGPGEPFLLVLLLDPRDAVSSEGRRALLRLLASEAGAALRARAAARRLAVSAARRRASAADASDFFVGRGRPRAIQSRDDGASSGFRRGESESEPGASRNPSSSSSSEPFFPSEKKSRLSAAEISPWNRVCALEMNGVENDSGSRRDATRSFFFVAKGPRRFRFDSSSPASTRFSSRAGSVFCPPLEAPSSVAGEVWALGGSDLAPPAPSGRDDDHSSDARALAAIAAAVFGGGGTTRRPPARRRRGNPLPRYFPVGPARLARPPPPAPSRRPPPPPRAAASRRRRRTASSYARASSGVIGTRRGAPSGVVVAGDRGIGEYPRWGACRSPPPPAEALPLAPRVSRRRDRVDARRRDARARRRRTASGVGEGAARRGVERRRLPAPKDLGVLREPPRGARRIERVERRRPGGGAATTFDVVSSPDLKTFYDA